MKILIAVIATLIISALAAVAFIYSGLFNVAADSRDNRVLDWVLATTRDRSIDTRTDKVKLPGSLKDIRTTEGFKHYREMCEKCHGGPGIKPTDLKQGLNPKPPDLYKKDHERTPELIFWVAKHGIKMSAMPAFGKEHEDSELMPVIAFVNRLPDISEEEYRSLIRQQDSRSR